MKRYRFALQQRGTQIEELGVMAMADDGDALAFAKGIARDLADSQDRRAGLAIAIVKGTRTIRSIPLKQAPYRPNRQRRSHGADLLPCESEQY
jgi:hypothetical protein